MRRTGNPRLTPEFLAQADYAMSSLGGYHAFDWATYRTLTQHAHLSGDQFESWLAAYYRGMFRCDPAPRPECRAPSDR